MRKSCGGVVGSLFERRQHGAPDPKQLFCTKYDVSCSSLRNCSFSWAKVILFSMGESDQLSDDAILVAMAPMRLSCKGFFVTTCRAQKLMALS